MFTYLFNIIKKGRRFFLLFLLIILNEKFFSQEVDIVPYLKKIEEGKIEEVKKDFASLKNSNSQNFNSGRIANEDPSLIFLEAVLTEDGEEANKKYSQIVNKYPHSKYADAALYRIYSYNYAIGSYQTAQKNLAQLQKNYPNSPYLKSIQLNPSLSNDEVKIIPENKEIKSKTNKKYLYTIQVGAFINFSNAKELMEDLTSDGYTAEIKEKIVGGSSFNVVNVGNFFSKEEAEKLLPELKTKYEIQGRVVQIDN